MPTRVQLPNGQVGEFPDGMTPQQIEVVLQKQFPAEAKSTDPSGRTPTGEPARGDTRNAFQRTLDNLVTRDPRREEWQGSTRNTLDAFSQGVAQNVLQPIAHPLQALKGIGSIIASPNPVATLGESMIRPVVEDFAENGAAHAVPHQLGNLAGMAAAGEVGNAAGKVATPAIGRVGEAMQHGGEGIINRTIGATKSDFARGANPGQGYFQAKLGPSLSMGSIADKAAAAHEAAGESIGNAIDAGAGRGVRIPTSTVAGAVNGPADAARSVLNGPFGPGSDALDGRMASFRPELYPRVTTGPMDMSPKDVFGLKRNVAKNVNWSDPTAVGIKQVGQQITGGLSGVLSDAVPELKPLNSLYQNTGKLADRAAYRADTGISPLTQMGRKGAEAILGAGIGYATHHPLLGALPLVLDSVPARTAVASGLHYGGGVLPGLAQPAATLAGPAAAVAGVKKKQPDEEADEK